jgi:hypothetical protein
MDRLGLNNGHMFSLLELLLSESGTLLELNPAQFMGEKQHPVLLCVDGVYRDGIVVFSVVLYPYGR